MTNTEPPGWRWERHESLASTQDFAISAGRAGDPGKLAVLARRQTQGRGSRGRDWISPLGNLNLSVLIRPANQRIEPGRWALLAGIVVYDALRSFAPGLMLKWPNDILLHGAKLGGILIDCELSTSGAASWVVVGVGANLAEAPEIEGRRVAQLPSPAPQADYLARRVVAGLDRWAGRDMALIREAWLDRAQPVGTLLDVQVPGGRLSGAFLGLTLSGELMLEGAGVPFSSAEIWPVSDQAHKAVHL